MDEYIPEEEAVSRHVSTLTGVLRNDIYYIAPLAYHGYKNGEYVYNDGQPFVFTEKFAVSFENSQLAQKLFPYAGQVIYQHLNYREKIKQDVAEGKYTLITNIDGMDQVFTRQELEKRYELLETLPLRCGNWTWDVEFWVKK